MKLEMMAAWGSWELLLLGGAVLRHGTYDWNAVASELRVRTLCPYSFTPEVCKTKYEELQQHYSGCIALFEELKKQRVEELKRSLEQSDDSIGSLQSKLRNLVAEKGDNCHVDYGSSQTESPMPFQKSDGTESSGKETSKDGLSAGSFTQEARTNWFPKYQIPAAASARERGSKPDISVSSEQEKVPSTVNMTETIQGEQGGNIRKRRGKRKRKDCNRDVNEGSVGESDFLGPADVVATVSRCKENSTSDCGPVVGSSAVNNGCQGSSREGTYDLMRIFYFVLSNENASSFCRRHDSQKRARYKNLVRQHMDFDTIRSRIANYTVKSSRELFRDLLLLTNNALVFYSKTTREHKCALLLRDHITKILRQNDKCSGNKAAAVPALFFRSPMSNAPVKPRSARPCHRKPLRKAANARNIVSWLSQGGKKSSKFDLLPSLETLTFSNKGGTGHPRKAGCVLARQQPEAPLKERKRARRR